MEYLKTFGVLVVFVILSVACITNIIRHSKEKKIEKAEKRARGIKLAERSKPSDDKPKDGDNPFEVDSNEGVSDIDQE